MTARYRPSDTDRGIYLPVYQNPTQMRLRRARGKHDLAILKSRWLDATVFLADEYNELIGTAFLLLYREDRTKPGDVFREWGPAHLYLVTALHVVEDAAKTFATIRTKAGEVIPIPVDAWYEHPSASSECDIAVAPFALPDGALSVSPIDTTYMVNRSRTPPHSYGQDVYYAGLLTRVVGMGERMVPMVRSGKLGAWDQPGVPFGEETDEGDTRTVRAHLIDCYGYYGFSGSPCFIEHERYYEDEVPHRTTSLFGVLLGFFNHHVPTKHGPVPELPVNAGIGVVAPAWYIIETLEMDDLVKDREKREEKMDERERRPKVRGFSPASAAKKPGPDPDRLQSDETLDELAKRVMDAGKPDDWDDEDGED